MLCCVVGRGAETQLASGWSKTVEQTFCRGCFHEPERGTSARWKKKCQNRQDSLRLENQKQPIGAGERSHAAHEENRGKNVNMVTLFVSSMFLIGCISTKGVQ